MHFEKSPFHYWSEYLDPAKPAKEPTEAMIFGNAFHTYVLEHHEFGKRYAVEPQHHLLKDLKAQLGDKLGKDRFEMQKLDYEEFLLKSRHKTILSINQLQTLRLMHESLQKHEQGMALLQGGLVEQSVFWSEPHTGELCKTRPDVWQDGFTADLKTIAAADERSFVKAMMAHGYHVQAAMNREGIREQTGKDIKEHIFVCVEKTFPYAVAIYRLDISALDFAHVKFKKLITDFAECKKSNSWRGYETKTIFLPKWAENE